MEEKRFEVVGAKKCLINAENGFAENAGTSTINTEKTIIQD